MIYIVLNNDSSLVNRQMSFDVAQARSQEGAGIRHTTPNLPKGSLLVTKWAKNEVFVGGLGWRFKNSTFWVRKVHFCEVPHLPKIDPGYGPARRTYLGLTVIISFTISSQ